MQNSSTSHYEIKYVRMFTNNKYRIINPTNRLFIRSIGTIGFEKSNPR
jgi:hypothetical protein